MPIDWISAAALACAIFLLAYLAFTLLYPEKF